MWHGPSVSPTSSTSTCFNLMAAFLGGYVRMGSGSLFSDDQSPHPAPARTGSDILCWHVAEQARHKVVCVCVCSHALALGQGEARRVRGCSHLLSLHRSLTSTLCSFPNKALILNKMTWGWGPGFHPRCGKINKWNQNVKIAHALSLTKVICVLTVKSLFKASLWPWSLFRPQHLGQVCLCLQAWVQSPLTWKSQIVCVLSDSAFSPHAVPPLRVVGLPRVTFICSVYWVLTS